MLGKVVVRCPLCCGSELGVTEFHCTACSAVFSRPKKSYYKNRRCAIIAHGQVWVDIVGGVKKYFVTVCPQCKKDFFLPATFTCSCGNGFSRQDALYLWEA